MCDFKDFDKVLFCYEKEMESLTISTVGRFLRNSIIENFIKNDIEYCPENHDPFDPDFDIPVKVDNVFFKVILVVHSIKSPFYAWLIMRVELRIKILLERKWSVESNINKFKIFYKSTMV